VRGVGHDHGVACRAAVVAVIRPDHQDARQFSLGARRRLQGGPSHAGDRAEGLFQLPHEGQRALHLGDVLVGMQIAEAGHAGHLIVELRVVLHGARAQGVEAQVDGVIQV